MRSGTERVFGGEGEVSFGILRVLSVTGGKSRPNIEMDTTQSVDPKLRGVLSGVGLE